MKDRRIAQVHGEHQGVVKRMIGEQDALRAKIPKVATLVLRHSNKLKLQHAVAARYVQYPNQAFLEEKTLGDLQPVRLGFYGGVFHNKLMAMFGKRVISPEDEHRIQLTLNQFSRGSKLSKIVFKWRKYSNLRIQYSFQFLNDAGQELGFLSNKTKAQVQEWLFAGYQVREDKEELIDLNDDEHLVAVKTGLDEFGHITDIGFVFAT